MVILQIKKVRSIALQLEHWHWQLSNELILQVELQLASAQSLMLKAMFPGCQCASVTGSRQLAKFKLPVARRDI
jgi:hypothetical protein